MTKGEFLETLEQKLTGEIDAERVRKNLQYYDRYIEDAIRSGRTEQEVLEELGSPLLIARTIIDTNDVRAEAEHARWDQKPHQGSDEEGGKHTFHMEMDDKKAKVMALLIIILILILAFTVLRILLPILLPVVLVLLVINLVKKR